MTLSELIKVAQQPGPKGKRALTRLQDFLVKRHRPPFEQAADEAATRHQHGHGRYPYFVIFSIRRKQPHFDWRSASTDHPPAIEADEIVVWDSHFKFDTHRFVTFTQPPRASSTKQRHPGRQR